LPVNPSSATAVVLPIIGRPHEPRNKGHLLASASLSVYGHDEILLRRLQGQLLLLGLFFIVEIRVC
jgi:hypothetical protein